MKLSELFKRCLNAKYLPVEQDGDYGFELEGRRLYLYFQWSDEKRDWFNNFDFFPKKYGGVGTEWYCHRGYLRVWESMKPSVREIMQKYDGYIDEVFVIGYSHGAALATIAFDWVWYNYPHLRDRVIGYGFGAPRVYFGFMNKDLKARWFNFHPVRDGVDIVTHVPFALLGFRHVNKIVKVGNCRRPVKSHYPGKYMEALEKSGLQAEFAKTYAEMHNA